MIEAEVGQRRSVSVVAGAELVASIREVVDADASLQLVSAVGRFTDLVVEASFPGDVVVLAEEPGRALFAHAQTALAAGALVIVHADVPGELREALEQVGAHVVPRDRPVAAVAERAAATRLRRRRSNRHRIIAPDRPRLSPGERRALAYYVQGLTTVQVAAAMGVGYETAKTFLRRVRAKYAAVDRVASKRTQLIERAHEDGIL